MTDKYGRCVVCRMPLVLEDRKNEQCSICNFPCPKFESGSVVITLLSWIGSLLGVGRWLLLITYVAVGIYLLFMSNQWDWASLLCWTVGIAFLLQSFWNDRLSS